MTAKLAESFLRWVDRKGWVTWERQTEDARVLMVTNAWPRPEFPMHGIFMRYTVEGLAAAGVRSDVLFIRGYRGPHCYLLACAVLALAPVARPGKYRLVHSHGGEASLPARCFFGAPVLASYWGSDILGPHDNTLRSRVKQFVRSRVLRAGAALMTATTTKSAEMATVLPARARRRNWVIPDGVDRTVFRPRDRDAARAAVGWPADELTVISVGQPRGPKRLWLAEETVALATAELGSLRWRAIADVPPEDMPLHYNAADLLLHTSASEGSPNVIKEALACDLPVVATPAGDVAELLEGVEPSAVAPPQAEILAREVVRCLRPRRRSNGRERSEAVGLEQVSARTLECYRALGVE